MEQQPSPAETRRAILAHLTAARELLSARPAMSEGEAAVDREAMRLITRAKLVLASPG